MSLLRVADVLAQPARHAGAVVSVTGVLLVSGGFAALVGDPVSEMPPRNEMVLLDWPTAIAQLSGTVSGRPGQWVPYMEPAFVTGTLHLDPAGLVLRRLARVYVTQTNLFTGDSTTFELVPK